MSGSCGWAVRGSRRNTTASTYHWTIATAEIFPLLGHSSGLFWERPTIWLAAKQNEERWTFWEGQTMGVETFLSHPGVGSVGVEQNIIVHDGRNELLTPVALEWW